VRDGIDTDPLRCRMPTPLLTFKVHQQLCLAANAGMTSIECSLDLDRSIETVAIDSTGWIWRDRHFPFIDICKDRTIYFWDDTSFEPVSRYTTSLIKLVPTSWGAPTFEIDGIKMLPTAQVSPYVDAERKVALIAPRGKAILDCCGGLGYFAAWCLQGGARAITSFEKNPDVIWLRSLNPWSPPVGDVLKLINADISQRITSVPTASVDAILHDPPRFGIAGELYSQVFYDHLARVITRKGRLFHYTGAPNKLTSGRDVPKEVAKRLEKAGFTTELIGDGVLAVKRG
jgi:predicted methyltransferase